MDAVDARAAALEVRGRNWGCSPDLTRKRVGPAPLQTIDMDVSNGGAHRWALPQTVYTPMMHIPF